MTTSDRLHGALTLSKSSVDVGHRKVASGEGLGKWVVAGGAADFSVGGPARATCGSRTGGARAARGAASGAGWWARRACPRRPPRPPRPRRRPRQPRSTCRAVSTRAILQQPNTKLFINFTSSFQATIFKFRYIMFAPITRTSRWQKSWMFDECCRRCHALLESVRTSSQADTKLHWI